MAKSRQVRIPEHVWSLIEEKAYATFGIAGQETAFLMLLLQGNPATSAPNQVAAPKVLKNKDPNKLRKHNIIYMYDVHKEQFDWITKTADVEYFLKNIWNLVILKHPELEEDLQKTIWKLERDPEPDEMVNIEEAAKRLHEAKREWLVDKRSKPRVSDEVIDMTGKENDEQ